MWMFGRGWAVDFRLVPAVLFGVVVAAAAEGGPPADDPPPAPDPPAAAAPPPEPPLLLLLLKNPDTSAPAACRRCLLRMSAWFCGVCTMTVEGTNEDVRDIDAEEGEDDTTGW
jgi:hypothetical protein